MQIILIEYKNRAKKKPPKLIGGGVNNIFVLKLVDHEPQQVRRAGARVSPAGKLPVLDCASGDLEIIGEFLLAPACDGAQLFYSIIQIDHLQIYYSTL